jgi:hypothetical protein
LSLPSTTLKVSQTVFDKGQPVNMQREMGINWQRALAPLWRCAVVAALALSCGATQAAPVQVALSTAANSVTVGSTFEIRIRMSGLSSASGDSLAAFDFSFGFDSGVASYLGFDFLDSTSGINQLELAEAGSFAFLGDVTSAAVGSLQAFGLSGNSAAVLDGVQTDAFDMLRLRFRADAVASGVIFNIDTRGSTAPFVDTNNALLAASIDAPSISLEFVRGTGQSVPEPGSAALSGLALGALLLTRRKRYTISLTSALLVGCVAATAPSWATAQAKKEAAVSAAAAQPAPKPAVQGVVQEVVGQRFKVLAADGRQRWFTATGPLPTQIVNKQARGTPRAVGDSVALDQLTFE